MSHSWDSPWPCGTAHRYRDWLVCSCKPYKICKHNDWGPWQGIVETFKHVRYFINITFSVLAGLFQRGLQYINVIRLVVGASVLSLDNHLNSRASTISEKVFGWARLFDIPFAIIQFWTPDRRRATGSRIRYSLNHLLSPPLYCFSWFFLPHFFLFLPSCGVPLILYDVQHFRIATYSRRLRTVSPLPFRFPSPTDTGL
jgi:hypothetical protein